jgi:hypothetical protein
MNKNTGILLAVVGFAVILVVLMKGKQKATQSSPSYSIDLTGAAKAIGGIFSSGGKAAPPGYTYPGQTDTQTQAEYGLSHGTVVQEGNQLVDVNTGGTLVYGTD